MGLLANKTQSAGLLSRRQSAPISFLPSSFQTSASTPAVAAVPSPREIASGFGQGAAKLASATRRLLFPTRPERLTQIQEARGQLFTPADPKLAKQLVEEEEKKYLQAPTAIFDQTPKAFFQSQPLDPLGFVGPLKRVGASTAKSIFGKAAGLFQEARKYPTAEEFVRGMEDVFSQKINVPVGMKGRFAIEDIQNELQQFVIKPKEIPFEDVKRLFEKAKAEGKSWAKGRSFDNPSVRLEANIRATPEGIDANVGKLSKSQLTDIWNKAQTTKERGFIQSAKEVIPEADKVSRLITQGRLRILSKDGKNVYQFNDNGAWKTASDEGSAAVQAVKKSPEYQEKLLELEIRKEALDNDPAKELTKYVSKQGDFKGELKEVTGEGTTIFSRKGDDIVTELGFQDSETARLAYAEYTARKADIADLERGMKEELAEFRNLGKAQPEVISPRLQGVTRAPSLRPESAPVQQTSKTPASRTLPEGEAMSLEKSAQQALSKSNLAERPESFSLISIIERTPTPVKKKINIIDFVRTPDRVLAKIGLGNEAAFLRRQYEQYVKEIPGNIEKITEWSKRVPKESNVKIFKYLDGKDIELSTEEKKVAGEVRDWLKEWADRLGLPEDRQISNYITHIFDDQLVKKEFDEDLAKIIRDKIPGSVYDPFLQKRLGALGYKQDTWGALGAYVKRATRKVHLDPALARIEEKGATLEQSQWNYVKNYLDRVNMRPTDIDTLLDNTIKSFAGYRLGQRPVTYLSSVMRRFGYRGMLGLNLGSALRNLSQGANTYAKLGEKYTAIGYAKLFSPSARSEVLEQGILDNNIIQDRLLSASRKAMQRADKGLFVFFDAVERINRSAAYLGAKAKGIGQGMTEEQAIEYAKKIVRDTQFSYTSIDTPAFLQSDIMKTFFQFQTFTAKQVEFLAEMAKHKEYAGLLRYGIAGLAYVYTIGQAFGMEDNELVPLLDYFTGERRFGLAPALQLPKEIAKAALDTPNRFGGERDIEEKTKDILNAGSSIVPAGVQIRKTLQGIEASRLGVSADKSGRKQFEVGQTPAKKAQAVLFGKYASPESKRYFEGETYAEAQYKKLLSMPREQAAAEFDRIIKDDPNTAKNILRVKEKIDLGIDKEDEKLLAMGVQNKARATAIKAQFDKLKTKEEKAALWEEYANKKIITKDVAKQLEELLKDMI